MRTLLLALTLAVTACSGSSTPSSTTTTTDPVDNAGGSASTDAECDSDDDCVASCSAPEECCDELCSPCRHGYTVAELAEHDAWKAGACADESCPMAKCMAPTERGVAWCNVGQCEVRIEAIPPG